MHRVRFALYLFGINFSEHVALRETALQVNIKKAPDYLDAVNAEDDFVELSNTKSKRATKKRQTAGGRKKKTFHLKKMALLMQKQLLQ
jgi:hypothetical protein